MCDQNLVNVQNIIQQTRRLNVADTDRRRIRRRRQRQQGEAIPEEQVDPEPEPPMFHDPGPTSPRAEIGSSSGNQQEYYEHPSVVTQEDIDELIHQQQHFEVPVPRRPHRQRRRPPCGT